MQALHARTKDSFGKQYILKVIGLQTHFLSARSPLSKAPMNMRTDMSRERTDAQCGVSKPPSAHRVAHKYLPSLWRMVQQNRKRGVQPVYSKTFDKSVRVTKVFAGTHFVDQEMRFVPKGQLG